MLSVELRRPLLRVYAHMQFKLKDTWGPIEHGLIDTGAHTSVLPESIWKNIQFEIIGQHVLKGVLIKKECEIPVKIAKITAKFIDAKNVSKEYIFTAYLVDGDKVPLLIGFRELMELFGVTINIKNKEAFIEV